jgi:RimJ/RimL family protein N-acetyltransferase
MVYAAMVSLEFVLTIMKTISPPFCSIPLAIELKLFITAHKLMNAVITLPSSTRLSYRLMSSADAPLWFELDQDPEVMRYLNDGKPSTWQEIQDFLVPRVVSFTDPAKGLGLWQVNDKSTDDYLGWVLARHYRFDDPAIERDNIELGWRFKRQSWGRGIATEAAQTLAALLRCDPSVRVLSALADPRNLGSIGVMKKLGMQFVEPRIHRTPLRDYPSVYYEMPAR